MSEPRPEAELLQSWAMPGLKLLLGQCSPSPETCPHRALCFPHMLSEVLMCACQKLLIDS